MGFDNLDAISTLEYALEANDFGDEEVKAAADLMLFSPAEWEALKDKFDKEFIAKAASIMKKIKLEYAKSMTEMGIADSFLNQNKGDIRFCGDFEHGWMIFDNRQWMEDKTDFIKSKIRDHIKKISNGEAKLEKSSVLNSIEKLVQIEQKIRTTASDWDNNQFLLGIPNGVIDLKTGAATESHKELLISKRASVAPAKTAICPIWESFLNDITDSDEDYKKYLQKLMGYFLTGSTMEQSIFFGFGPGGNGKSIWGNVINLILGDYFGSAPFTTFAASASDHHPTDLAGFVGKRCIVVSETQENRSWNINLIKSLSGQDKIAARFMHGNFFEYMPNFKLMVIGNYMPNLTSVDHSSRRRFHILPFLFDPIKNENRVKRDFIDDLKPELPSILKWAIDGCILWQKEGLKKPKKVQELTDYYFEEEDVFTDFLRQVQSDKDLTENKQVGSSWLFGLYAEFLEKNGELPSSNKRMSQQMKKLGYKKIVNMSGSFFVWKMQ